MVAIGFFGEKDPKNPNIERFAYKIEIPNMLSYLAFMDVNAYIPGIRDLVHGNETRGIMSYDDRIARGKMSIDALAAYKTAKKLGDDENAEIALKIFNDNFEHFGYGYYFGQDKHLLVPDVKMSFYAFHIMVILGFYFVLFFMLVFLYAYKNKFQKYKWLLWVSIWTIPWCILLNKPVGLWPKSVVNHG